MTMRKTKQCQSFCGRVLKLSEFPPNKQYGKKRHPYCRKCCAEKMRRCRAVLKQRSAVERKEFVIWKPKSKAEKIIRAIQHGKQTQSQIARHTNLRISEIDILLAGLILDERKVKSELVDGERLYFERIAA